VGLDGVRQAVTGGLDVAAVLARRDAFVKHFDDAGQVGWLDGIGVPLVRGTGRLSGVREVTVTGAAGDTVTLRARHAVAVCTGSDASLPPVPGLADVGAWDSRDATSATAAPGRLLVLGGGVVGVEMATAWASLGSAVTLLQRGPRILASAEPEAGELVAAAMRERGIDVRTGVQVTAARREPDGTVVVTTADGEVRGDELLVAAGRRPRTDDLGLDVVGLQPGHTLTTDDSLLVEGVDGGWLYAVGDVNGRAQLTHQGKYQGRACGQVIAARARGNGDAQGPAPWSRFTATADDGAVPQVVFSSPQVASVGLTEDAAVERGVRVWTAEQDLGAVAGAALLRDGYSGWAKLVVDGDRRVLVGATFVGPDVAELLHAATVAVVGEVPIDRLWHAVPSFPTVSEVWLRLLDTLMHRLGWAV
jgi:dihydrolipoamide dehydrogenase